MALTKTWSTTSGKPRPSHAAMDGETVPIDEPFSNGLMYPGDLSADVGEIAGCTCVMTTDGTAKPRFDTVEAAQDHITQTMHSVGNTVPYPVHLNWRTAAGAEKKVSVEIANKLADAIDNIATQIPDALGKVSSFAVGIAEDATTYAWVSSRYPGTVNLSAKWFSKSVEALEARLAKDVATGWHVGSGIEGTLTHEIAHVLFGTAGSGGNIGALLKAAGFEREMIKGAGKVVSKYAAENLSEFVAEAFSGAVTGGGKLAQGEFVTAVRKALIDEGILKP